jgi:hypothetical protein
MSIAPLHPAQPTAKQQLLSYVIGTVMLGGLLYGYVQFHDAPIRECASGYCGKGGQFHTAAEYLAFGAWEKAMMIGWPIGLGIVLFLQRNRLRR